MTKNKEKQHRKTEEEEISMARNAKQEPAKNIWHQTKENQNGNQINVAAIWHGVGGSINNNNENKANKMEGWQEKSKSEKAAIIMTFILDVPRYK